MTPATDHRNEAAGYLAAFLGPKGENAVVARNLFLQIFDDYFHWRRNYYPADPPVLMPEEALRLRRHHSDLEASLLNLLAGLRRSFPFYSPRYLAHQQGEVSIPALLGSFAGMLYNSNNVTSESGAVTLEYEISACSRLLTMIGFTPPPDPPPVVTEATLEHYHAQLSREYGWCHLTSGGTIANIEALWVARAVKYFPLSVRDAAATHMLNLLVKLPSDSLNRREGRHIADLTPEKLLGLRPNESIFLLKRYLEAVRSKNLALSETELSNIAWEWLDESDYSLSGGLARCMRDFPPKIFVTGAAHYSLTKAADLLGLGQGAIQTVKMDSRFRLDASDLDRNLRSCLHQRNVPLVVVGIAGTTEEGAIDPIDRIVQVRDAMEREIDSSFWIHVDAAWGGYFRTLLHLSEEEHFRIVAKKVSRMVGCEGPDHSVENWIESLFSVVEGQLADGDVEAGGSREAARVGRYGISSKALREWRVEAFEAASARDYVQVLRILQRFQHLFEGVYAAASDNVFRMTVADHVENVSEYVRDDVNLAMDRWDYVEQRQGSYQSKPLSLRFNDPSVISAIHALCMADSVTVDPHKLGYLNYPCGAVAFRNDWIRGLIRQRAPYITSVGEGRILHLPPRHLVETRSEKGATRPGTVVTEAFAPYTLEGSRPSFPATALWLSTELLPLDQSNHGSIMRASWLAARELYEWLVHLDDALKGMGLARGFRVMPFCTDGRQPVPPDSNIVIFGIQRVTSSSVSAFNEMTSTVYKRFSIRAESGEQQYSYSHPFFLSHTRFEEKHYDPKTLSPFLKMNGFQNGLADYRKYGLDVLRATIMSPYIVPLRCSRRYEVIRSFVELLAKVANEVALTGVS